MNLGDLNIDKIISKLTITRLKDLIKSIRNCKTTADERAVIAKESAYIRTAFKEDNNDTRHINVAKLLYIHMLGYPAHFGQIDCLKLVASPRYADKKLGYLGIMLLLDENQEVLTLVTNCLKNDLNNSNLFTVGIALCTLGNISSAEMARDLCSEVEKLLGNSNSYVRKKAALCALRIIKKVPELLDNFVPKAPLLLVERNHGVLLTGMTLLIEMCSRSASFVVEMRKSVPVLVRFLKNLSSSGFSPEHDVGGITDPFLQIKTLKLLRLLGRGDAEASDAMNDVLAQVATNTDGTKIVGNAVLYEAVVTMMDIESDQALRVMGVNILGKFLTNKDSNIKYVALTTLARTSAMTDAGALQRHRSTILECLRDADISIRRRALDLGFILMNSQNIRILTRELLSYLEVCEGEMKDSVSSRLCDVAGRFRPNKRWEVDTVIRVLRVAGAYVDQNVVNYFTKLVSTGPLALCVYATLKLFAILRSEGEAAVQQDGLVQAALWCFGEYGQAMVEGSPSGSHIGSHIGNQAENAKNQFDFQSDFQSETQFAKTFESNSAAKTEGSEDDDHMFSSLDPPSESDVVDLIGALLRGSCATVLIQEYCMTCMLKLLARFTDGSCLWRLRQMLGGFRVHLAMELQKRSVEAAVIWTLDASAKAALLERMPVLESAEKEEALKGTGSPVDHSPQRPVTRAADLIGAGFEKNSDPAKNDDLLSLVFETNLMSGNTSNLMGGNASNLMAANTSNLMAANTFMRPKTPEKNDALMDLFGYPQPSPAPSLMNSSLMNSSLMNPSLINPTPLINPSSTMNQSLINPSSTMNNSTANHSILDGLFSQPTTSDPLPKTHSYEIYNANHLKVTLSALSRTPKQPYTDLVATYTNTSSQTITNLSLQVAVPKSLKLTMQPASNHQIAPQKHEKQAFRIDNPSFSPIKLRVKLAFTVLGQSIQEMIEVSSLDQSLWQ